jgi:hypothetical protein
MYGPEDHAKGLQKDIMTVIEDCTVKVLGPRTIWSCSGPKTVIGPRLLTRVKFGVSPFCPDRRQLSSYARKVFRNKFYFFWVTTFIWIQKV